MSTHYSRKMRLAMKVTLINTEFFTHHNGEVVIDNADGIRMLTQQERRIIEPMLDKMRERRLPAVQWLENQFQGSQRARMYYEFLIVRQFIKCMMGKNDTLTMDIDELGEFHYEKVDCPVSCHCAGAGLLCKGKNKSVLSQKEQMVIYLKSLGNTEKQVAYLLKLSPKTIHAHMDNCRHKLNAHSSAEVIRYFNATNQ